MSIFSKIESRVEDGVEGAASAFEKSALTPVQITKKAEKQMKREKVVGAGRQIAPTLYTCLVSPEDDDRLFGYYPTLAGEVETYLQAKAEDLGLSFDCKPLVRFVPDPELRKGKFDVIAELVAPPTIAELRAQENERYGIAAPSKPKQARPQNNARQQRAQAAYQEPPKPTPAMRAQEMTENSRVPAPAPVPVPPAPVQPRQVQPQVPSVSDDRFSGLEVFNDPQSYGQPSTPAPVPAPAPAPVPVSAPQVQPRANIPQIPQIQEPPVQQQPDFESQKTSVVPPADVSVANNQTNVYFYDEVNDIAYSLTGGVERIGRESTNEIVVSDINASRTHAEIHMEPNGQWVISDLGSTNGLYVNEQKVQSAVLNDADIVLIGTTRLEFQNL